MSLLAFQSFSKIYLLKQKQKENNGKDANGKKVSFFDLKYYNKKDPLALAGDRGFGNMQEQAILFLPLLWMHAIFVDPSLSLPICLVYSFTRAVYPFLFLTKFFPAVFISTVPGYAILTYFAYGITNFALS